MNAATTTGAGHTQASQANGQSKGGAAPVKRIIKKKAANPFAVGRQPGHKILPNGQMLKAGLVKQSIPSLLSSKPQTIPQAELPQLSGFSDPAVKSGSKQYTDFKLVATKKELLDGLRYHIMHLPHGKDKFVDIRDPKQFPLPAHLHRRDPRSGPARLQEEQAVIKDGMNDDERQALKDRTEQRKAERAANLALIAPTQTSKRATGGKPKTKIVYKRDFTEEEKRKKQTNYEEKLPWHLEDFDNKYCLVSSNQGTSARRFVAFAQELVTDSKTSKFRLVPVDKVYEFEPKRQVGEKTLEEVLASRRGRKIENPDWLEDKLLKAKKEAAEYKRDQLKSDIYTGASRNNNFAGRTGEDVDLDYDDGDIFADDEEGDMFNVKDEEEAAAEKRIREDQLTANFFEVKDEEEYDRAEQESEKEEKMRKLYGRELRRNLGKHEHQYQYLDDDSEYSSSSEDEEDLKEKEAEAERKRKEVESLKVDGVKASPGSGANTPSRKDKGGLSDREGGKSRNKLKRTGSPNLSDAGSGTDTSRAKKPKMNHASGVSRPGSPAGMKLKGSVIRGGAGSDTEAGALSDAQAKRLKPVHRASSIPSRTASPAPAPAARSPVGSPPPGTPSVMPSLSEVAAVLAAYPQGVIIKELIKHFKIGGNSKEFIQLIKPIIDMRMQQDGSRRLFLKDKQALVA